MEGGRGKEEKSENEKWLNEKNMATILSVLRVNRKRGRDCDHVLILL